MSIKVRHIGLDTRALDIGKAKGKTGRGTDTSFHDLLEAARVQGQNASTGLAPAELASLTRHIVASRSLGLVDGLFTAILLKSLAPGAKGHGAVHGATKAEHPGHMPGALSARFESGLRGVAEVGYDPVGGTSYGVYQISSRAGTFARFVDYLRVHAPLLARRLEAAGPANTGSTEGMLPDEWRRIASEHPGGFARLQYGFIHQSHYLPAVEMVEERTGLDLNARSQAVKEVLFSTAVQHGSRRAAEIFTRALEVAGADRGSEARLIEEVYRLRGTRFGSSSRRVKRAVLARFGEEMALALNILKEETGAEIPARA